MNTKLTPLQLVYTVVAANLLVVMLYCVTFIPRHVTHKKLFVLIPMIAGYAVAFWAEHRLGRGSWEFKEREAAYSHVTSKPFDFLNFFAIGLYLVLFAVSFAPHGRQSDPVAILLLPLMSILRLRTALRPPRQPSPPADWRALAPIHSDHWGELSPTGSQPSAPASE